MGDLQRIVGLSFQIIDDIIDLTQPTEILGKTAKKDLVAQKKTLPLLLGIDTAKKELNKNKRDALDIISNLKLSDHPLKFSLRIYSQGSDNEKIQQFSIRFTNIKTIA